MNKFWLLLTALSVTSLQAQTASDTLDILNLLEKNREPGVQVTLRIIPNVGKSVPTTKYGSIAEEESY